MKEITYSSKVWLREPKPLPRLLSSLHFRLIGCLDADNFLVQRYSEHRPVFHLLHISWGTAQQVEKYKLFRVDIFAANEQEKEENERD